MNNNNSTHSNGLNGSIEESKYSDRGVHGKRHLHIPNTNLNIIQTSQNVDTSQNSNGGGSKQYYGVNNQNSGMSIGTKQLISPHSIASKYQSLSTKNEEIKGKVKMFENLFPQQL